MTRSNHPDQNLATTEDTLSQQRHDLLFGVRRSVRYHMRPVRFFDRWHMITNVSALLFGTATIASVLGEWGPTWTMTAGVIVAGLSTVDLFVGTSRQSRDHNDLAKDFIDLEKQIVATITPTPESFATWEVTRLELEKSKPPVRRTLDIVCHNELMQAMGYPENELHPLSKFQRFAAHFL